MRAAETYRARVSGLLNERMKHEWSMKHIHYLLWMTGKLDWANCLEGGPWREAFMDFFMEEGFCFYKVVRLVLLTVNSIPPDHTSLKQDTTSPTITPFQKIADNVRKEDQSTKKQIN